MYLIVKRKSKSKIESKVFESLDLDFAYSKIKQIFANYFATYFGKERKWDLKDKERKVKSPSLDQVDSSLVYYKY